jgi:tetratricopeptide (TPR) repeat protein
MSTEGCATTPVCAERGIASAGSPPRRLRTALPAAIFLLTCVSYLPAIRNDFVSLDDPKNFLSNYHYRGLGWDNIRWACTTFHNGIFQPLSWILFSAEYVAFGLNPTGYHVVSAFLQAINAVLFYVLARRLLLLAMPEAARKYPSGLLWAAALASGLFALHPLRTEVVAWLSCQPYLPVGAFYILALLAYLRACDRDVQARARWAWLGLSCACYAASILSKCISLTIVAVLVLLDIYPLRRLRPKMPFREAGMVLLEKLPFLILNFVSAALAVRSKLESMVPVGSHSIPRRLVHAAWGAMFYLEKTLVPINLSPWYEFPANYSPFEVRFVIAIVLVVLLTALAIGARRRWLAGTILWAYYLLLFLPSSHLVRIGRQSAADRYSYVVCMGWAILGGAGFLAAWRAQDEGRLNRSIFSLIACGAVAVCAALGTLSWRQTGVWRTSLALWGRAAEVSPGAATPRSNYGEELRTHGDLAGASRELEAAIRADPNNTAARINLSMVMLDAGRPDKAIEELKVALKIEPNRSFVHGNLGATYLATGRLDEAIPHLRRAIELRPNDESARCNLATALIRKKQYDEAIEQCRAVIGLVPDLGEAYSLWGMALAGKGQAADGIERLRKALEVDPGCVGARLNLSRVLADQQQYPQAIELLRPAAESPQANPRILAELARLLLTCPQAELRNPAEALRLAEEASRKTGGHNPEVLELVSAALAAGGAFDQAIAVGEKAAQLARSQNRLDLAARISGALDAYRLQRGGIR